MKNTRLDSILRAHGKTQVYLAEILKLSPQTISHKMNNKIEWRASEIRIVMDTFNLTADQVVDVFILGGVYNASK